MSRFYYIPDNQPFSSESDPSELEYAAQFNLREFCEFHRSEVVALLASSAAEQEISYFDDFRLYAPEVVRALKLMERRFTELSKVPGYHSAAADRLSVVLSRARDTGMGLIFFCE